MIKKWIERIKNMDSHRRSIAVVMAVVLFVTSLVIAPSPLLSANSDQPYITMNGKKVSSVVLEENEKIELKAESSLTDTIKYYWQIRDMRQKDRWIKIAGGNSETIDVSYALIGSMLDEHARVDLRCRLICNNREYFSESVEIQVSCNVYDDVQANEMIPVTTFKDQ